MPGDISGIKADETIGFLSAAEKSELFGSGAMKPDVMRIPNQQQLQSMTNLDEPDDYSQMNGEFKIERGFHSQSRAQHFHVTNPTVRPKEDYVVYTVVGILKNEKFEILRRYSDFDVLRESLCERFPGLYIPPIPPKKAVGNKSQVFIDERCFLLNMFLKQLSRCPYLVESLEFELFVQPKTANLQRELSLLPQSTPENQLAHIQKYYSFMGEITDS